MMMSHESSDCLGWNRTRPHLSSKTGSHQSQQCENCCHRQRSLHVPYGQGQHQFCFSCSIKATRSTLTGKCRPRKQYWCHNWSLWTALKQKNPSYNNFDWRLPLDTRETALSVMKMIANLCEIRSCHWIGMEYRTICPDVALSGSAIGWSPGAPLCSSAAIISEHRFEATNEQRNTMYVPEE